MPKPSTSFVCRSCGIETPKWVGKCPNCGQWNTMEEVAAWERRQAYSSLPLLPHSQPQRLSEVPTAEAGRVSFPMAEFCRVLGGGLVPGSAILLGGDPGIGKSTLLLQVGVLLAQELGRTLYVSGEESAQQVKGRAQRLGLSAEEFYLLSETSLERILDEAQELEPKLLIVDSIQAIRSDELPGSAGTVAQVRECASQLVRLAKAKDLSVFVVGHVTKAGAIAGPRVLEHMVDTVLYLQGERFQTYRLLRSVKNRFGPTDEIGVFEMGPQGMREVANPSQLFLAERMPWTPGSAVVVALEGTRPLLVEIQALTTTASLEHPRRRVSGLDFNRLLLLLAVLSKRAGIRLSDKDVYVNVVGGLRLNEPAVDLSVAAAIASSVRNDPVPPDMVIIGEVGLLGELRAVGQAQRRLQEAGQLGFQRCLMPQSTRTGEAPPKGLEVIGVQSLREALEVALGK